MNGGFLGQAFVYLAAAVVAVPLAKRLGLGAVLGYLVAGVAIGPFGLGFLGTEGQDVMHFAEFGVVMMLFVVGLELEPALLWRLRTPILGLGGLQVLVTGAALALVALLLGLAPGAAIVVGMTLSLSSTAIVLQVLSEKGWLRTSAGQSAFAVLLFQDIAVIPMLALFPLLAMAAPATEGGHVTWVSGLPGWARTLVVLAAVAAIVAAGRFVVRPLLRAVARTRLRELFTAAALLLVIGIALLMEQVGLSPALGTFLAGVVLADSEYRHELESDIEPFKGLLLGLFFIAVGASIDFALVGRQPLAIGGLVLLVLALKAAILYGLARVFGLSLDQRLLFALALPQVGEFAFVLLAFATALGIVTPEVAGVLVAVVALTMAATPLLLLLNERVLQPRVGTGERPVREADAMHDEANAVVICGFDHFGNVVGRFLLANGVGTTVIDNDSDRVELLRRIGLKVYYGDPTRHDLLAAAGAGRARLIVLALDEPARNLGLVHTVRTHFPGLEIMARAADRPEAYDLMEAGVPHVFRETFDTSVRVGEEALRLLGWRAHQAHRRAQAFRRYDEHGMQELAPLWRDQGNYWNTVRRRVAAAAQLFEVDRAELARERDAGWDPETLREEMRSEK